MYVIKRDGKRDELKMDEITERLRTLSFGLKVDPGLIATKVAGAIFPGVKTDMLDELAGEISAYMSVQHPDYGLFAGRILFSNLQKKTLNSFYDTVMRMFNCKHPVRASQDYPLVSEELVELATKHRDRIESEIDYSRDVTTYDYTSYQALTKTYLISLYNPLTKETKIMERPQHLWMRVAFGVHGDHIEDVITAYHRMSQSYYSHATPTLCQAGTPNGQLASCFLLHMDDSTEGIFKTIRQIAIISRGGGGVGFTVTPVRSKGSIIKGVNGISGGTFPTLKTVETTLKFVQQERAKRPGSGAAIMEIWHADFPQFINLRNGRLSDDATTKSLFLGVWACDLFFKRVLEDGDWHFFSPDDCPDLIEAYGDKFEHLYEGYEKEHPEFIRGKVKAKDLWFSIINIIIETSALYVCSKDQVNLCSNQKNVGTITNTNLCTEIMEYCNEDEIAVCTLASVNLARFVVFDNDLQKKVFDFVTLGKVVKEIVVALNRVIDRNCYPLPEAEKSSLRHRPIGLGTQGFHKTLMELLLPWDSEEAYKLNYRIFETIHYNALEQSWELAKAAGKPYETFKGSPASHGLFHIDMMIEASKRFETLNDDYGISGETQQQNGGKIGDFYSQGASLVRKGPWFPLTMPWEKLRPNVAKDGTNNCLILCQMPTAGTSLLFRSSEGTDPIMSSLHVRRVVSGEFVVVNPMLVEQLEHLNLWNEEMRDKLILYRGSVQDIDEIPQHIKEVFKTSFEITPKAMLDMAIHRSDFIDQSISLNAFMDSPTPQDVSSWLLYGWSHGLKTILYYLRERAASDPNQSTLDVRKIQEMFQSKQQRQHNNSINSAVVSQIIGAKRSRGEEDGIATSSKRQKVDGDETAPLATTTAEDGEEDPEEKIVCSLTDGSCIGCSS